MKFSATNTIKFKILSIFTYFQNLYSNLKNIYPLKSYGQNTDFGNFRGGRTVRLVQGKFLKPKLANSYSANFGAHFYPFLTLKVQNFPNVWCKLSANINGRPWGPHTISRILEKMWGRRCEIGVLTFFLVFTCENFCYPTWFWEFEQKCGVGAEDPTWLWDFGQKCGVRAASAGWCCFFLPALGKFL